MPKNIVICSDGTGNTAVKGRGTNVLKVFEAVDQTGYSGEAPHVPQQVAFYDDGVGTQSFAPHRLISGAFGWGLTRNVKQLYTQLASVYEPEDRLFLFGFSRGAFTVRTLAGLIANCGIVEGSQFETSRQLKKAVDNAYSAYRSRYAAWLQRLLGGRVSDERQDQYIARKTDDFCEGYCQMLSEGRRPQEAKIAFIGVWDTVDAVGVPSDLLASFINQAVYRFSFPDFELSECVQEACHAVSIDDQRRTFHPVLWDESSETEDRIQQVWFSGVHSNVGGGYPQQGLALVALDWMMTHAEGHGLQFTPELRQRYRGQQNLDDKLYDSRAGLRGYYRYRPRDIASLCGESAKPTPRQRYVERHRLSMTRQRPSVRRAKIHSSALQRIAQSTAGYAPANIPADFEVVSTESPAEPSAESIAAAVQQRIRPRRSLLESCSGCILARQCGYYVALASTIMLAVAFVPLLRARFASGFWLWITVGFSLLLVTSYAVTWIASCIMRRRLSAFWHPVRSRLAPRPDEESENGWHPKG